MLKASLERGLNVELTDHVGYERGDQAAAAFPNSRNGTFPKTVGTEIGDIELAVPRDRRGTFTPMLVPRAPVGSIRLSYPPDPINGMDLTGQAKCLLGKWRGKWGQTGCLGGSIFQAGKKLFNSTGGDDALQWVKDNPSLTFAITAATNCALASGGTLALACSGWAAATVPGAQTIESAVDNKLFSKCADYVKFGGELAMNVVLAGGSAKLAGLLDDYVKAGWMTEGDKKSIAYMFDTFSNGEQAVVGAVLTDRQCR